MTKSHLLHFRRLSDLGWTVTDLIRKKGSQAAKVLTDKADELEKALKDTTENYSVEMMED